MFKVNIKDTRIMSVNSYWYLYREFEHILHLFREFLWLTLNK